MALYHRPWPPTSAPAAWLDPSAPIEEETLPRYTPARFYPIRLGQILNGRYQVATKLGYGSRSTVWLARDLSQWQWLDEKYVAIKVKTRRKSSKRSSTENEVKVMRHIAKTNPKHEGWQFVRKLISSFPIEGTSGHHTCLVFEPLREPLWLYCSRYAGGVVPPEILKILVRMMLHALDYLHSECHVIHTDLKPDNIMIKIEDPAIFHKDAKSEFNYPLPEKQLDDRTIYLSRNNYGPLSRPTGVIQLVDFDRAVHTTPGELHTGAIGSEMYRAPEVILNSGYTFSADIWSLGVLVTLSFLKSDEAPTNFVSWQICELLEGKNLFSPGSGDRYDDLSHLGQISALLGPASGDLLHQGRRTSLFYNDDGEIKDRSRIPSDFLFENAITNVSGEEKIKFLSFIKRMIIWKPEERGTAKELLNDSWLCNDFSQDWEI